VEIVYRVYQKLAGRSPEAMKCYLAVTVDTELYRKIENIRGREKRSTFVEHLLRLGMREYRKLLEEKQDRGEVKGD